MRKDAKFDKQYLERKYGAEPSLKAIYDGPLPEYDINPDGIMVLCKASDRYLRLMKGEVHHPVQGEQDNKQDTWSQNGRKKS